MSLVAIGSTNVTRARLQAPRWGIWWLDIDLPEAIDLSGAVVCSFAGLDLHGTVMSGGVFDGKASYRIVGGAGGWGKEIPAMPYADDSGVKVSTILSDAASAVGETIADPPSTRVAAHYARRASAASVVLHDLLPRAWRVGFDGRTYSAIWPAAAYSGDAPRTRVDHAIGVVELAVETAVGLAPGVNVDGLGPATDIELVLDAARLTARCYFGPRPSRRLDAWRRILTAIDPRAPYRGLVECRVVTQDGERLNLQAVRASSGVPDLERVPVRPGMAGIRATVLPGSLVLVAFIEGDPSRPVVVSHDAPDAPGWMPLEFDIGEAPRLGIARQTDPVVAGPFAGTITLGSVRAKAGS